MAKIVVFMSVSLDGVIQSPGRPDEDRRGGFERGGWGVPYSDAVIGRASAESGSQAGAMLLGRRTYEDFYSVWHGRTDNPYSQVFEQTQKYVVSNTREEPLPWRNSTLLRGEATETVAALKAKLDRDIVVLGSGELVRALIRKNLIDSWLLLIHPLVLGAGRRLFEDDGPFRALRLVSSTPSTTGVVIAKYEAA